jgi:hypothetical protein
MSGDAARFEPVTINSAWMVRVGTGNAGIVTVIEIT